MRNPKYVIDSLVMYRDNNGILNISIVEDVRVIGILRYKIFCESEEIYEENIVRKATVEDLMDLISSNRTDRNEKFVSSLMHIKELNRRGLISWLPLLAVRKVCMTVKTRPKRRFHSLSVSTNESSHKKDTGRIQPPPVLSHAYFHLHAGDTHSHIQYS
jgi:hypothetical protein